MHVAFLPFLPHPVTDIATGYTTMLNYVKLFNQLEQKTLPLFCNEGVFRLVLNIYLKRPQQFKDLVPMLGGFHMAKCVQRSIGKYIKGTGLEDALVETGVFGVKVMELIIEGKDYVRSLRGVQILSSAIELAKWKAFWKLHDKKDFEDSIQAVKEFANFLDKKDQNNCIKMYKDLKEKTKPLTYQFNSFSKACTERSEVCKYCDVVIDLTLMLHNLIAADREGDWEGHLQAVQDLLPVFCEADCINYLRYATWYLEKMRKPDQEHADLYAEFHAGKFVVQTSAGTFKAVSPDMKPEQTINCSQKSSGGIVGQTKTDSFYVLEWELVYHEVLAISNCFSDLTKSKTRTGPQLHHELAGGISKQLSESMNTVTEFITERGNPYKTLTPTPLDNITGGQVLPKPHSKRLLNYFEDRKQRYKVFGEERYVNKSKKLSDTITKVNLPKFDGKDQKQKKESKLVLKKVGDAQKQIYIARARGISMKEILSFDHLTSNLFFEEDLTAKRNKSDLVKQLEKQLAASDTSFTAESKLRTAIIVDFMSLIQRYPVSKLKTFDDLFRTATYSLLHAPCTEEIDIVYDSYLEHSIKECERIRHHSSREPLEFVNMKTATPIPVQMDRFWACGSNKEAIQEISRDFFKSLSRNSCCRIVLSGYVTDSEGIKPCIELYQGDIQICPDLYSTIEEADSCIIPYVQKAIMRGVKRVIVHSNDTDVLVYLLYYMHYFINLGKEKRYIPIQKLGDLLGPQQCKIALKAHVLTGCDVTSKVGTKFAALNSEPGKYLMSFSEMDEPSNESLQAAEKYLVEVVKKNSKCDNFNDLTTFINH